MELYRANQKRDEYLKRAQTIVWNKYSPEVCAKHFLDVITEKKQKQKPTGINTPSFRQLRYPIWRWRIEDYKLEFLKNLIFSKCSYINRCHGWSPVWLALLGATCLKFLRAIGYQPSFTPFNGP